MKTFYLAPWRSCDTHACASSMKTVNTDIYVPLDTYFGFLNVPLKLMVDSLDGSVVIFRITKTLLFPVIVLKFLSIA